MKKKYSSSKQASNLKLTGLKRKTQYLYFQLKAHANRKGVCHCVKDIIAFTGASEKHLRELLEQHLIDVTKQEDTIILL